MSHASHPVEPAIGVAVIGMSCRFPGAPDVASFWRNLAEGVESVTPFTPEELAVLPAQLREDPRFVGVAGSLPDADRFDAALFGLNPREAALLDPQHRLFLECAWQALVAAGHDPSDRRRAVGVFAGAGDSGYRDLLVRDPAVAAAAGALQLAIGTGKDHLAPRLSYLLDLRGPSVPVQTACSTSLVAVHLACQSLLHFECDVALAGGVSIPVPLRAGYLYQEGGTLSPDGRCRAFDAAAKGTAQGSGAGVVVLKRLEDALADGDHVHAVILGSAINNDGAAKVGYTAPGVEGQRRVVQEALALAGLEATDISYVEAHGTGTTLGDPIEVEALRQAFGSEVARGSCALGSVKTNIGHADAAAGVAGLIKAILCLEHRTLVPNLHFARPNPELRLEDSPFAVPTQTKPWEIDEERGPRRHAGVSSFGIGGTNAHVVLGEAPPPRETSPAVRRWQLATLSAHTATALATARAELADSLPRQPSLADAAFSLNTGRLALPHRLAVVAEDAEGMAAALRAERSSVTKVDATSSPAVIFLFPGQGKDYEDLGGGLYTQEAVFRQEVDACCRLLEPLLGRDLGRILFSEDAGDRAALRRPACWQAALFTVEYALARLWLSWGVQPAAMVGHSLGEIVAAAVSGVLRLEDALRLVVERGRGLERLEEMAEQDAPAGAMLALPMPEEDVRPYLGEEISLAAVNAPGLCIVSGPAAAIERLEEELAMRQPIRLETRHAFHSSLVEPLMPSLEELAAGFEPGTPEIPYVSNLTGTWMTAEEAADPTYWARHLRGTVRFAEGLETALGEGRPVLLEVGPGEVLSRLARRSHPRLAVISSLPASSGDAGRAVLEALGALWCQGVRVDWESYYAGESRRRCALPAYPLERQRYWIDTEVGALHPTGNGSDPAEQRLPEEDWLFLPVWRQEPLRSTASEAPADTPWLLLAGLDCPFSASLAEHLEQLGQRVERADPQDVELPEGKGPLRVIDAGALAAYDLEAGDDLLSAGFDRLVKLVQALEGRPLHLALLTRRAQSVFESTPVRPEAAAALGVARVLPKELAGARALTLDLDLEVSPEAPPPRRLVAAVAAEVLRLGTDDDTGDALEDLVVFAGGRRWRPAVEARPWPQAAGVLRRGGVYLITHGLQEMGLALAEHLAAEHGATAVLVDRSFFPPREEWEEWLAQEGEEDAVSRQILRLRDLPVAAVEVHTADPADAGALAQVRQAVEARRGTIHGVFHLDRPAATGLLQGLDPNKPSAALRTAVAEARAVASSFEAPDFLLFFSSNLAECGGLGQAQPAALQAVLASLARQLTAAGRRVLVLEWGTRAWEGAKETEAKTASVISRQLEQKRERFGIAVAAALATLERALGLVTLPLAEPVAVVSTRDFAAVMAQQHLFTADFFQQQMGGGAQEAGKGGKGTYGRPELSSDFEAPRNEVETLVVELFEQQFGIEGIGVHDNFFELGGHSLIAVQLLGRVNETFSSKLVLKDFFNAPTVAELAAAVSGTPVDEDEAAVLERLLAEIEGLSNEEVRSALAH